jgi:ABC-type phosphate transport system substrate-binding protein
MMRSKAVLMVLTLSLTTLRPAVAQEPFRVIVNAKVNGRTVTRATLAQIYLGEVERWGDGHPIVPVDLSVTSPVRAAFSQAVLQMSVFNVRGYWSRTMGIGRRPPMTRADDDEVIAFVTARAGAIGYVSDSAVLPPTVKTIEVQ